MARVMVIHDAARQAPASNLRLFLAARGHQVALVSMDQSTSPSSALDAEEIDVLIVDLSHEEEGFRLVHARRAADARLGLVLLVDEGLGQQARIDGLLRGADFCEARPVRFDLLAAYVDAMSRRITPDAWRLDTTARTLHAPRHEALGINDKELTLLQLLAHSNRHAADRSAIARAFGMDWLSFDERALEKMVSRLRRKWREGTCCDLPLKTMHGVGYCFTEAIQIC